MAGYSGTPLLSKIGIRPGQRVHLDNVPEDLQLDVPDDVTVVRRLVGPAADVTWTFCAERARLERRIDRLVEHATTDGMLWVSWPKETSRLASDLDGNVGRSLGLAAGVVDVKVAAVDETWSALKFVRRRADRGGERLSARWPPTGRT